MEDILLHDFLEVLKERRFCDLILLAILTLLVYRNWFSPGIIMYGDLHAWSKEKMLDYFSMPYGWETAELGGYYSVGLPGNTLHGKSVHVTDLSSASDHRSILPHGFCSS